MSCLQAIGSYKVPGASLYTMYKVKLSCPPLLNMSPLTRIVSIIILESTMRVIGLDTTVGLVKL